MELQYETTEVCEFKVSDAFNYWIDNQHLSPATVGEKFEIHPKYLWQEYARHKASNQQGEY